ncbi:hypothetical protein ABT156_20860, partial [Streptomyces sp. NPDC001833]
MPRPRFSTLAAACATAFAASLIGPATGAQAAPADHYSGTLSDGATWIADKPAQWNGSLLLFSHGFGPTAAADAPSGARGTARPATTRPRSRDCRPCRTAVGVHVGR